MLIRAGASNRAMVAALGVNVRLLYTLVFGSAPRSPASRASCRGRSTWAAGDGELILIEVFVVK